MRKSMVETVSEIIKSDKNTALLLVDIGIGAFRDMLSKYSSRVCNIGIFEPGMISVAAGLSLGGITPTVYGIGPFIAQRALEQLKLDFVYQKTGGNFITTGASYDFSTSGYTHYCPEDVATLRLLPGMEIVTPGTPSQFSDLYRAAYNNGNATYFRLTDHCNRTDLPVQFGKASVAKQGAKATVIAVAETLDMTLEACSDLDVTVLYYTTLSPFDRDTLRDHCPSGKILVCEPFYRGTLYPEVMETVSGRPVIVDNVGVPLEVLRNYGTKAENDIYCGLTAENIRIKLTALLDA